LQFLSILTDSLIESKIRGIFSDSKGKIFIRALQPNKKLDWFFENRLVEVLQQQGAGAIYFDGGASESAPIADDNAVKVIEYRVIRLGIEYFEDPQKSMGLDKLGRKGVVSFLFKVLEPASGKILLSEEVVGTKSDWYDWDDRARIEDPNVSFTKGMSYGKSGPSKSLQALVLTGVSGVIVFLFYSLRSR
ncbi:hypothetical protein MJD09_03275, partial [bacterium]|nr:hypothetical protein [bacterium]